MDSRMVLRLAALGAGGAVTLPAFLEIGAGLVGSGSATTAIAAALAAGIAAAIPDRPRWLEAAAIAGFVILAVREFFAVDTTLAALGAALLLGSLAGVAKDAAAQAALVVGGLTGVVASNATLDLPRRYAEYLSPDPEVWQLVLIAIGIVTLLAAKWPANQKADSWTLAVCAALPFVILLSQSLPDALLIRVAIALAVIVAAFMLGRSGVVLLAGAAISGVAPYFAPSMQGFLIVTGLFIVAAVLGLNRPYAVAGIGALALITTPIAVSISPIVGLIAFAAAFAVAYSISSSLAAPPPALAIAIALPALPSATSFAGLNSDWLPSLILAAYAVAAYFLSRRSARS